MIAQLTPVAFAAVGWRFYLVFAVCSATNALFFWAFLPETRGLPLEEVDEYFGRVPVFVPGARKRGVRAPGVEEREEALRREGAAAGNNVVGHADEKEKGVVDHVDRDY
jgi:hypothetical protein